MTPKDHSSPRELLQYISQLARLYLTPEEEERYAREFQAILDYVQVLKNLPVEGVEPTAHPFIAGMPLRDDEPQAFPDREGLLAQAPGRSGPFFTVPRFLGKEG